MAASSPPHRLLPPPSSGRRRRSRGAWQQEEQEELQGQMPPPLPPLPPAVSGRFPVEPPSPFVLTDANAVLFSAVLSNWTRQECGDCRMVLAAPGVYPVNEARQGKGVDVWTFNVYRFGTTLTRHILLFDRNRKSMSCRAGGAWRSRRRWTGSSSSRSLS